MNVNLKDAATILGVGGSIAAGLFWLSSIQHDAREGHNGVEALKEWKSNVDQQLAVQASDLRHILDLLHRIEKRIPDGPARHGEPVPSQP